jgi:hypothetical protein
MNKGLSPHYNTPMPGTHKSIQDNAGLACLFHAGLIPDLGRSLKEVCSAAGHWYHTQMKTLLPLKEMTTAEKVRAMEEIWADLSSPESSFTPPDWHGDVLAERKKGIMDGSQRFTDWEAAKKEIRKRVS